MKIDIEALGTIYEMADEGAELAAGRLTPMIGLDTRVAVTRLEFTAPAAVYGRLDAGGRRRGIRTAFSGGLDGTALALFDDDSAEAVLASVLEGVDGAETVRRSALAEVGQIVTSGFVDGWADVLDARIDLETPTVVAGRDPDEFLTAADFERMHDELALLFGSRVETDGAAVEFEHLLFPDHESMLSVLDRQHGGGGGRAIEYEKLTGFDRLVRRGATRVTDHLAAMTGIDASVDVRRVNFVSLDAIPRGLSTEPHVSVAFSFDGLPSGYLLFLFDEPSAASLVDAATAGEGDLDALGRDAVGELSNVMASGLLDGWANMLDTTIDHSPPAYAHDMGAAVVDPLVVGLSDDQEFAFVFDTRIAALDATFDCEIYAIPDEADLERALDRLDLSRIDGAAAEPEFASATANVDGAPDELETSAAIPEVEE